MDKESKLGEVGRDQREEEEEEEEAYLSMGQWARGPKAAK